MDSTCAAPALPHSALNNALTLPSLYSDPSVSADEEVYHEAGHGLLACLWQGAHTSSGFHSLETAWNHRPRHSIQVDAALSSWRGLVTAGSFEVTQDASFYGVLVVCEV